MVSIGRSSITRYLLLACIITFFLTIFYKSGQSTWPASSGQILYGSLPPYEPHPDSETHPIDTLIRLAQDAHRKTLQRQPRSLEEGAAHYRSRRGRHPPPGFEHWHHAAVKRNAFIVEDFFDQIYHDLTPFWALEAKDLRIKANAYIQVVRVRDHVAFLETDDIHRVPWIQLWHGLIKEAAAYLPDVDVPINFMDETRILVPWDEISRYAHVERSKRQLTSPENVISVYPGLRYLDSIAGVPYDPNWIRNDANRYWDHMRMSCPPDSPARNAAALEDFEDPIDFPTRAWPPYSHEGYVKNWTEATDVCQQPHLRSMHGAFIEPVSMSTTHELIPLFGGSKHSANSDILLPGAMYLSEEFRYSQRDLARYTWSAKSHNLLWRGVANGGRNRAASWHHFHRHRFVQALNGTLVQQLEAEHRLTSQTFALPNSANYDIPAQRQGKLGEWLDQVADAAFVHLECFPAELDGQAPRKTCSYTDPYFSIKPAISMQEMFRAKLLPDVDGNSFSGRYRGFLLSNSLPLKATVYREWHDSRLQPWVHFVPMDNSFGDLYGLLAYLLSHDPQARRIADEGRAWAQTVMRREDMLLYVWRLLLEWARICDDQRDRLGYVGDLKLSRGQKDFGIVE